MQYNDPDYTKMYDSWLTTEPEQQTEEEREHELIYMEIFDHEYA